jgi:hypothetical protein
VLAGAEPLVVRLQATPTVCGSVVDAAGLPVPHVRVAATWRGAFAGAGSEGRTDAAGQFRLPVEPGACGVCVDDVAWHSERQMTTSGATVCLRAARTVTWPLVALLTWDDGMPIADRDVQVWKGDARSAGAAVRQGLPVLVARTARDGSIVGVRLPPGTYDLVLAAAPDARSGSRIVIECEREIGTVTLGPLPTPDFVRSIERGGELIVQASTDLWRRLATDTRRRPQLRLARRIGTDRAEPVRNVSWCDNEEIVVAGLPAGGYLARAMPAGVVSVATIESGRSSRVVLGAGTVRVEVPVRSGGDSLPQAQLQGACLDGAEGGFRGRSDPTGTVRFDLDPERTYLVRALLGTTVRGLALFDYARSAGGVVLPDAMVEVRGTTPAAKHRLICDRLDGRGIEGIPEGLRSWTSVADAAGVVVFRGVGAGSMRLRREDGREMAVVTTGAGMVVPWQ